MSVETTEWNIQHIHPKGTWWQYINDRRFGELTIAGSAVMAVISTVLVVWAVLTA